VRDLFPQTPPQKPADPREKRCAGCGSPRAPCGMAGQWFCVKCAPADYWPMSGGEA
jgi:hypothetical protein